MGKKRGVQSKRGSVTKRTAKKKPKKAPARSKKHSKDRVTAKPKQRVTKRKVDHKRKSKIKKSKHPARKHKDNLAIKRIVQEEQFVERRVKEYIHPQHTIPVGIRVLITYLTFLGILYVISFVYGITLPMTILLGQIISGMKALFINGMLVALLLLMLYGFWRRKAYAFDLSLAWFGFSALNSFASLVLLDYSQYSVLKGLMLLSFISMLITSGVIMWYIHAERKYFYAKHFRGHRFEKQDKVFVYTIATFWILALLIGGTMGAGFLSETKGLIDDSIPELKTTPSSLHEELCLTKEPADRDVCLIVAATMKNTDSVEELDEVCEKVGSDFYRFTCYKTLKR